MRSSIGAIKPRAKCTMPNMVYKVPVVGLRGFRGQRGRVGFTDRIKETHDCNNIDTLDKRAITSHFRSIDKAPIANEHRHHIHPKLPQASHLPTCLSKSNPVQTGLRLNKLQAPTTYSTVRPAAISDCDE